MKIAGNFIRFPGNKGVVRDWLRPELPYRVEWHVRFKQQVGWRIEKSIVDCWNEPVFLDGAGSPGRVEQDPIRIDPRGAPRVRNPVDAPILSRVARDHHRRYVDPVGDIGIELSVMHADALPAVESFGHQFAGMVVQFCGVHIRHIVSYIVDNPGVDGAGAVGGTVEIGHDIISDALWRLLLTCRNGQCDAIDIGVGFPLLGKCGVNRNQHQ